MINSRRLEDLLPVVAVKCSNHLAACKMSPILANVEVFLTCTYRDEESQAAIYAEGRTQPGRIRTKAKPGFSYHQYRVAYDVAILKHGKLFWDLEMPEWQEVGKLGIACGLEWAGLWTSFREGPHFQYTGGLKISDLRAGKVPK